MSVIVATAYMDEASRFDWLAAMDDGKVIANGTPKEILERANKSTLDDAFIALLPPEKRGQHQRSSCGRAPRATTRLQQSRQRGLRAGSAISSPSTM